jgi:hypothetical protein
MKRATTKEVRTWLLMVMARMPATSVGDEREAEAIVQMMAPGLRDSYPQAAFTEASLQSVCADLQWFREADVRERLDRWRKVNLPDASTLPDEAAKAPVDEDGRNWIARWLRATTDKDAATYLSLIQAHHKPAFAWLLRTDTRAAGIAVRRGWPDPNANTLESLQAEWRDRRTVEAAIQSCFGRHLDGQNSNPTPFQIAQSLKILSWLIEKYAPENLDMVPDAETALVGT